MVWLRFPGSWPDTLVMTPRRAHQAQAVPVTLGQATGRVAAEAVVPYPPGQPVVLPGERITPAPVEVVRAVRRKGGHRYGGGDPSAATVRVLKDDA